MKQDALDFSQEEYDSRLSNVRREMAARNIDVLVVDQFEHLVYLFGYLPTAAKYQACLLPRDGSPHMIVRGMDLPVFANHSWVESHRAFADADDPIVIVADEIRAKFGDSLRVGMEMDSHLLTVQRYLYLIDALARCEFVDFSGVMAELRLIKSPCELTYLREAARIADACMKAAIEAAAVGVSEREAAAAAYMTAMRRGADNGRVLLGSSGPASDAIHGPLGTRVLERGDVLHLEMVPQVRGYSARLMRPTVIGEAAADVAGVVERLIAIQDEQIAAMGPGRVASEIDAIAREQILGEKLCGEYLNHTGYTLGHHAQPRTSDHTRIFTQTSDWRLQPGMVFHMFLAARGVAMGETILVTEEGSQRLTRSSRQLNYR